MWSLSAPASSAFARPGSSPGTGYPYWYVKKGAWSSVFLANLGVSLPQLLVRGTVARTKPGPEVFPGCAGSHRFAFRRRQDGGYTLALGNYLEHFISANSFRYCLKFLPALRQSWDGIRFRIGDGLLERLFPTRKCILVYNDMPGAGRSLWSGITGRPVERRRPVPHTNGVRSHNAHNDEFPRAAI